MALVSLSQVPRRPISWLWHDRVPRGAITLLDGDPGLGKSALTLYFAAQVSTGGVIHGNDGPVRGGVLLLGEEDGLGDTVRPRLERLGADLARIHTFEREVILLDRNIERLEQAIVETGAVLVIIDPISTFLGASSMREQTVRGVLTRLRQMAERTNVAVIAIRHLAKSRANALMAGLGSVGIAAVARSQLILARDPAVPNEVVLAHVKSNLSGLAPSLRLLIDGVRPAFVGVSNLSADDLLHPGAYNVGAALAEAIVFLDDVLGQGATEVKYLRDRARHNGIAWRTLRKAKDILAVESIKGPQFASTWFWRQRGDTRVAIIDDNPAGGAQGAPPAQGHLRAEPPAAPPIGDGSAPDNGTGMTPRRAATSATSTPLPPTPRTTDASPEPNRFSFLEID